jgi:hypothetical protein
MVAKRIINWDLVELYFKSGCTKKRICEALGICKDTLDNQVLSKYGEHITSYASRLRSEGEALIEATQFQKAMKGYWPALQWLGKTRLGQREPEMLNQLAANQSQLDQTHRIMELEHQVEELKANADQPQTE